MTVYPGNSIDTVLERERLFVRLRFIGLVLLGPALVLDPRPVAVPPDLLLQVTGEALVAGFILNGAAWLLLRLRRLAPGVALLAMLGEALFLIFLVSFTGGNSSALWPLAFFLIAAAALRYDTKGALVAALVFSGLPLAYGTLSLSAPGPLYEALVRAALLVTVAITMGWVIHFERRKNTIESDATQQALQRSQSDVRSFATLTDAMAGNTNYQTTLHTMLELGLHSLRSPAEPEDSAAGMILLFNAHPGDALMVAAHVRLEQADRERYLSPITGALQKVLASVDPIMLRDAQRDPLLGQFDIIQKYPAAVVLPLRSSLMMFGVAVFMGPEQMLDVFSQRLDLMEAYTNQAAIAVHNAQLFAQLDTERNTIVDSEERVRHELARDLHDGPVNQVASLAMGLDFARLLIEKEPQHARTELVNLQRLAAKTARDMRTTMYRLRPLALESAGLSVALEQYVTRLKAEHDKPLLHFAAPDAPAFEKRLTSNAATMVFDIMNEALSNALKHSEAQNIWLELHAAGNMLVASVRDDGQGFDVGAVQAGYASRGSLGMVNMHERATLAQGDASIDSEPGHGTTVSVRVPLGA